MKSPRAIADFDSASGMLRALAQYLHGKDFPGLGLASTTRPLIRAVNLLGNHTRELVYTWSGWGEAIWPHQLGKVQAEEIALWVVSLYPQRQYPAVMVGSSNGAAIHLCAALGIPWLPQTFLIPVRRLSGHPDEPRDDMETAREPARALLEANPDLELHHMHDANQDRLMIQHMTYFRVKRLRLGEAFEQFLADSLLPGGTIFLLECQRSWPATQISERYFFQHGALGGATPDEYLHGSERVEEYLRRYGSHRRSWDSPTPTGDYPEAEWGFALALREDVERLARQRGYRVRRIVFTEPEHLSPLVADLYRWWYAQRRLHPNRLLIESFILLEPYWALRTGSAPFWMTFNTESSLPHLEGYLDGTEPYADIRLMLFSHGVESVGLVPIERWRKVLDRAQRQSGFVGVDERKYPKDFATFVHYHTDLKRVPARYAMPGPLTLSQLDTFLSEAGSRYQVQFLGATPTGERLPQSNAMAQEPTFTG